MNSITPISASLTEEEKLAIAQLLNEVDSKMPFLMSLTPEQRHGAYKLGEKTVSFVDKAIDFARTNPGLVPSWLDFQEYLKDYKLFKDILEIKRLAATLLQKLDDTAMEAGIEAFGASITFYNSVKAAAKNNVPGAKSIYEDLQKRFQGRGSHQNLPPAQ
ncbi:MAG: hypothetical protein WCM76_16755 [Bacteroidota bacterium]